MDECILCVRDDPKVHKEFEDILHKAIDKVNKDFNLRRDLGCDVQVGKKYSEIH